MLIVLVVGPAAGCVASGSSMGNVSVRGSLQSASGQRLPDQEIQFILPAAYGLGGLDLVLNEPEDFGHQDRSFSATTDAKGEFSYDLGTHIYHVGCWLLPPIGCFPKAPPPPFLLVRVPSIPGEYYAVQTQDGKFKVLSLGGEEISLSEAQLADLKADSESSSEGGARSTVGTIDLLFRSP
jgi:hypothetical protein